jgi:hypothetical protein
MFLTRSTSTTEQARVWLAPARHKVVHLALLIQIVFVSALRVCKMFDILEPPVGLCWVAMLGCNALPMARQAVLLALPHPSR